MASFPATVPLVLHSSVSYLGFFISDGPADVIREFATAFATEAAVLAGRQLQGMLDKVPQGLPSAQHNSHPEAGHPRRSLFLMSPVGLTSLALKRGDGGTGTKVPVKIALLGSVVSPEKLGPPRNAALLEIASLGINR